MTTPLTVANVLERAAEMVDEKWGQGTKAIAGGQVCAAVAIALSVAELGGDPLLDREWVDGEEDAWAEAMRALREEIGPGWTSIPLWNDMPGRTKEEVTTALRNAKRHLGGKV